MYMQCPVMEYTHNSARIFACELAFHHGIEPDNRNLKYLFWRPPKPCYYIPWQRLEGAYDSQTIALREMRAEHKKEERIERERGERERGSVSPVMDLITSLYYTTQRERKDLAERCSSSSPWGSWQHLPRWQGKGRLGEDTVGWGRLSLWQHSL